MGARARARGGRLRFGASGECGLAGETRAFALGGVQCGEGGRRRWQGRPEGRRSVGLWWWVGVT